MKALLSKKVWCVCENTSVSPCDNMMRLDSIKIRLSTDTARHGMSSKHCHQLASPWQEEMPDVLAGKQKWHG
jgi:hypothetical protein